MHELLLFGQVPFLRHDHILKILAGIAAMQPRSVIEHHQLFRPVKPLGVGSVQLGAKQGVQSASIQALKVQMHGDLFYLQLVRNIDADQSGSVAEANVGNEDAISVREETVDMDHYPENTRQELAPRYTTHTAQGHCSIEYRDLPEVSARRPVTSRLMATVPIEDGDPQQVMDSLGYKWVTHFTLITVRMDRLNHLQVHIRIHSPRPSIYLS